MERKRQTTQNYDISKWSEIQHNGGIIVNTYVMGIPFVYYLISQLEVSSAIEWWVIHRKNSTGNAGGYIHVMQWYHNIMFNNGYYLSTNETTFYAEPNIANH